MREAKRLLEEDPLSRSRCCKSGGYESVYPFPGLSSSIIRCRPKTCLGKIARSSTSVRHPSGRTAAAGQNGFFRCHAAALIPWNLLYSAFCSAIYFAGLYGAAGKLDFFRTRRFSYRLEVLLKLVPTKTFPAARQNHVQLIPHFLTNCLKERIPLSYSEFVLLQNAVRKTILHLRQPLQLPDLRIHLPLLLHSRNPIPPGL